VRQGDFKQVICSRILPNGAWTYTLLSAGHYNVFHAEVIADFSLLFGPTFYPGGFWYSLEAQVVLKGATENGIIVGHGRFQCTGVARIVPIRAAYLIKYYAKPIVYNKASDVAWLLFVLWELDLKMLVKKLVVPWCMALLSWLCLNFLLQDNFSKSKWYVTVNGPKGYILWNIF